MSDDAKEYINGWLSAMSEPKRKLLCSWHVDKNWRKQINEMVTAGVLRATLYKTCRVLLHCDDEQEFTHLLSAFLEKLQENSDTQRFGHYFSRTYACRPSEWALCFRKGAGLNTNMYLEAFHKTLKHVYLEGKSNRRVDRLLACLESFTEDRLYDRLIKICKGKKTYRVQAIESKHRASASIPKTNITACDDNNFIVKSQTNPGLEYTVSRLDASCKDCKLFCSVCHACVHSFTCTCYDHMVKFNMCKHIHAVASTHLKQDLHDVRTGEFSEENAKRLVSQIEHFEETQAAAQDTPYTLKSITVAEAIIGNLKTGAVSEDVAQAVFKKLTMILKDIAQNEDAAKSTPSTAHNRKAEKQLRFFSTKKKRTQKHDSAIMKIPTHAEKEHLICSLKGDDDSALDIHTGPDHCY
ncbi:uncharacterized protein LOC135381638 [Ornithodoros turicata]|uniref:uncharacterized protein LOC135381638 n=1 Tax=Ornithodoros turicata TaxID=34597 RepID=UPI003139610C